MTIIKGEKNNELIFIELEDISPISYPLEFCNRKVILTKIQNENTIGVTTLIKLKEYIKASKVNVNNRELLHKYISDIGYDLECISEEWLVGRLIIAINN